MERVPLFQFQKALLIWNDENMKENYTQAIEVTFHYISSFFLVAIAIGKWVSR